jgi:hypothetical protein
MGENTETIVVTSLSKGEFININYKKWKSFYGINTKRLFD